MTDHTAEIHAYTSGILRARREYERTLLSGTDCLTGDCRLDEILCRSCRGRISRHIGKMRDPEARAQLRAEYAYLLELRGPEAGAE